MEFRQSDKSKAIIGVKRLTTLILIKSNNRINQKLGWKLREFIPLIKTDFKYQKHYHLDGFLHQCLIGEFLNQKNKYIFNLYKSLIELVKYIKSSYVGHYMAKPNPVIKQYIPKVYDYLTNPISI